MGLKWDKLNTILTEIDELHREYWRVLARAYREQMEGGAETTRTEEDRAELLKGILQDAARSDRPGD